MLLATWLDSLNHVVSSGMLVALTLICLLQYVGYLWGFNHSRRQERRFQEELEGLECELSLAQKDRSLARYENVILREFLTQEDSERALGLVLRRFIVNPESGFAAFYIRSETREGGTHRDPANQSGTGDLALVTSRGLSQKSLAQLQIDPALRNLAYVQGYVRLETAAIQKTDFWNRLAPGDRMKVRTLFFIALGDVGQRFGLFISTDLYPPGCAHSEQMELACRLMQTVTYSLKHKQVQESQQLQLRTTKEILELRAIADRHYSKPLGMLDDFLKHLSEKVGAARTAVFMHANESNYTKALARTGPNLTPGVLEQWQRFEALLAMACKDKSEPCEFDENALQQIGVPHLIGSAMVLPLLQPTGRTGIMVVTRNSREGFSFEAQRLLAWAGEFLGETLFRTLMQARVEKMAHQDGLTELANRRTFDEEVQKELRFARTSGTVVSLLMLDLDRFKSVNDKHGHRTGDQVLRKTAAVLRDRLATEIRAGERGFAARYGGEELVVVLVGIGFEGAKRIAECIRRGVESMPVDLPGGGLLRVTTSIGLATCPIHGTSAEELVSAADAALYLAKASGRNRVGLPVAALV